MGQNEVLCLLRNFPGKWFSNKQISDIINISVVSTARCTKHIIKDCADIVELKKKAGRNGGCKTLFFRYKSADGPVA